MEISWLAFASLFGGALFGKLLRRILPEYHLAADSKDVVKLGMGLIATMSALVLDLLIASGRIPTIRREPRSLRCPPIACNSIVFWLTTAAGKGATLKPVKPRVMAMDILWRIRERAYQLWEQEGRPEGRHLDHWPQAEHELVAENAIDLEFRQLMRAYSKRHHQRDNRRAGDDRTGEAGAIQWQELFTQRGKPSRLSMRNGF